MYQFIDLNGKVTDQEKDLRNGLLSDPKYIPSYFIYDTKGSRLYEQICELPEYYLTRKEKEILTNQADEIAAFLESGGTIVELGSGNSEKTCILIESCLKQNRNLRYVPVDISKEILMKTSQLLYRRYNDLNVTACCGDYFDSLDYLKSIPGQKLVLWLGSSMGNFDKTAAVRFVNQIKKRLNTGDGLLIGIDLRKDTKILENAYNDSQGITSRYHLNCLDRFNNEYGADFKKDYFYHYSFYDEKSGNINAYIISKCDQQISVKHFDLKILLKKNEKIFNERSCKYSRNEILQMAEKAGLELRKQWFDTDQYYSLNLFR
jgi:L-histidine Nalpha-methyltransferase